MARNAAGGSAAWVSINRDTVGSEATSPNTSAWTSCLHPHQRSRQPRFAELTVVSTDPTGPAPGSTAVGGRFEDRPSRLTAEVDLTVEVTDSAGSHTSGRLVGTGHRLPWR